MTGTGTGLTCAGSGGILAALPMPLGSLTEPLSPRAFAGPGAIPLTPASCAGDPAGAASRHTTAKVSNADPRLHLRMRLIDWQSLASGKILWG